MKILLTIFILLTVIGSTGAMVSAIIGSLPMTLLFVFFGGMSGLGAHSIYEAIL
jgi:NhaP-type Na+/H+ or K+/H+ antiporter